KTLIFRAEGGVPRKLQEILASQKGMLLGQAVAGLGHLMDDRIPTYQMVFRETEIPGARIVKEINDRDTPVFLQRRFDDLEIVRTIFQVVVGVAEEDEIHGYRRQHRINGLF